MAKVSGIPTLLVNSISIYLYLSEIKEIQGSILDRNLTSN